MSRLSLSSKVLVAVPQLLDPTFHRAVVLLIEHDADGALGLVINHPTEHPCADLMATFELPWQGAPKGTVRRGGPVEPHSLWMLHPEALDIDAAVTALAGVAVSRSREALVQLSAQPGTEMVLVIGYAGWGPGQLEAELAQGSWIVAAASPSMVFEWPAEGVWRRALDSVGVDPAMLVSGSGSMH
ncbi:MAG: putative transcriptional regulator [Bradymonadia bacterium]|jgi:putative transcriptional regulator